MIVVIILALALMSNTAGENPIRSTFNIDKSNRGVSLFDFYNSVYQKDDFHNFNPRNCQSQIKEGRIQFKCKRHQGRSEDNLNGLETKNRVFQKKQRMLGCILPTTTNSKISHLDSTSSINKYCSRDVKNLLLPNTSSVRKKRSRNRSKKTKKYYSEDDETLLYDEDDIEDAKNRNRKNKKKKKRHYWGLWTEWSPCSVTCGRGRKIRWRKCIVKNCTVGELEMGEKTCQLPACSLLSKLLGL